MNLNKRVPYSSGSFSPEIKIVTPTITSKKTRNYTSYFETARTCQTTTRFSGIKMDSFHKTILRERIHRNKNYQHLFSPSITIKNERKREKTISTPFSVSKSTRVYSSSSQKHSITEKFQMTQYNQFRLLTPKNPEKLNFDSKKFYSDFIPSRAESLHSFNEKTKLMIKEKYKNMISHNTLQKRLAVIENNINLCECNIYNYTTTKKLLASFFNEYDLYEKQILAKLSSEKDKNERYKQKISKLKNDIRKLSMIQNNLQVKLTKNLNIKFFLLSIKNHSISPSDFCLEDQREIYIDNKLLQSISNLGLENFKKDENRVEKKMSIKPKKSIMLFRKGSQAIKRFSTSPKRFSVIKKGSSSSEEKIESIYNENRQIFSSVDEFSYQMLKMNDKIILLLEKYNDKDFEKKHLMKELEEKKEEFENSKIKMKIEEEIKNSEEKLQLAKEKNKELIKYTKKCQDEYDRLDRLQRKILSLYNLVNDYLPFKVKEFSYGFRSISYLEAVEFGVIDLLKKLAQYKEKYPKEYKIQKNISDKKNKIKLIQYLKEKTKENFEAKLEKIYTKSKKILFLPLHKNDEKLYIWNEKEKQKKKEEERIKKERAKRGNALEDYI